MQDLYEPRNSNYCYKDSDVLINKLNIYHTKDLLYYEAKITAAKLLLFRQKGITGDFSLNHFVSIHYTLFEDIYPFAGRFRNENIAKDNFQFANWQFIESELKNLLHELKKNNYLSNMAKDKFAKCLSYYMAELNVLHPFREGNGRTIREFIRQLSLKNGYSLELVKVDPKKVLQASIQSVVDTGPLEEILYFCLEEVK